MTEPSLSGLRALVTGASSGIGRAIAITLGQAGASVAVNYLGDERGAAEVVAAAGHRSFAVRADVSKEAEVAAIFDALRQRLGGLDILVGNAGIERNAGIAGMTLSDWERVLAVNLTGQFLCAREAVRQFRRQRMQGEVRGARGSIVFVNSVHQRIPWAGHANYAASKGGLRLLMESLAQELAAEGIRFNAVAPGAIRTPINREAWEEPAALERLLTLIPYGRIGEPEDIARAARWLCSADADYVVGATLFVDGGMSLYPGFIDNG